MLPPVGLTELPQFTNAQNTVEPPVSAFRRSSLTRAEAILGGNLSWSKTIVKKVLLLVRSRKQVIILTFIPIFFVLYFPS